MSCCDWPTCAPKLLPARRLLHRDWLAKKQALVSTGTRPLPVIQVDCNSPCQRLVSEYLIAKQSPLAHPMSQLEATMVPSFVEVHRGPKQDPVPTGSVLTGALPAVWLWGAV
jgi:hypothetical protein